MKTKLLLLIFLCVKFISAQVPSSWNSKGIGGGGALFSPSINPANTNEYYVSCDMSELFHSTDFGQSYSQENFSKIVAGVNSKVVFTSNTSIRYCLEYSTDIGVPVRSDDGGQTFHYLSGNPDPTDEIFGIWADYNSPDHIVMATYSEVYFSADGGNNFSAVHAALNNGAGCLVGGVFFDETDIFIGTNDGLIVSHNTGNSFATETIGGITTGQNIYSFAGAKQGATRRFYILTSDSTNIYVGIRGSDYYNFFKQLYSLDYGSGNQWQIKMSGITPALDFLMFVACAENDINTVYVAGSTSISELNVMKSSNAGTNWQHVFQTANNQNIFTGWCGAGGDHGWSYAESPFGLGVCQTDASKLMISDYGFVHVSSDGGSNWKQAYVSSADQHAEGSNTPTGQSYHSIGLENTSCWQVFWTDQNNMFACYSDIRGIRSTDAGNTWSFNYTGQTQNSTYRIAKNISSGTLYAATSTVHDMYQSTRLQDNILDLSGVGGMVVYSNDNGATWNTLHNFSHPVFWVATDPNNPNRLYACVVNHTQNAGGIWVSSDINNGSSSTWTQLSAPGRTEGHPFMTQILNDGTLVCTYSGRRNASGTFTQSSGVFIYNPSLQTWSDKSDNGMFYWTKDLVVDPSDPNQNTWYVGVFSGWGGAPNGLGGLYRTTDRGNSWSRISNLDRVTSCTFNPNNHNQLFLTTEYQGLWVSNDVQSSTPTFHLVDTYPFKQPERVFFNPYNTSEIWISSFGSGMKMGDMLSNGISFTENKNDISVYPSPTTGIIHYSNYDKIKSINVTDISGRIINSGIGENVVELKNAASGFYFLNFILKDDSVLRKKIELIRR